MDLFMEPRCKAKAKEDGTRRVPLADRTVQRWMIVTFVAAVACAAVGLGLLPVPLVRPSRALAQDTNRPCGLDQTPVAPLATRRLIEYGHPCPLPALSFQDARGQAVSLDDFRGRVVLINLWATWCPPCLEEMPSLNRLQQAHGSERFTVVAINQDHGGIAQAEQWLAEAGLTALTVYGDPKSTVGRTLKAPGLPVSLVVDDQGRELARWYGPGQWDSAQTVGALRRLAPQAFSGTASTADEGGGATDKRRQADSGSQPG